MVSIGRIVRNSAYLLAAQAPIQAVNAVYIVLLARWLGREAFGVYAAIWTILSFFATLGEQGLALYITRDIAREPDLASNRLSNGLAVGLMLGVASSAAMAVLALLLGYPPSVVGLAALVGIALWLRNPWSVLAGGFNAFQKMGVSSALMVAMSVTNAVVGLTCLVAGWGLVGVVVGAIVANAATLSLAAWLAHRDLPRISALCVSRSEIRRLLCASLPFGARALLGIVYFRADVVMLSVLAGFEAAGLYQSAYKVLELAIMLPGALNLALYPVLSALHGGSRDRLRAVFEQQSVYLAAIGLPLAAFLVWLAHPLISLLYGAEYESTVPILQWLAVAVLLAYLNAPLISVATSSDFQVEVTVRNMVALVVNIGLNLLLIPPLGGQGAALAMIGSEIVLFVALLPLVSRCVGGSDVVANLRKPAGAFILSLVAGLVLVRVAALLIWLAVGLYIVLLFMMNVFALQSRPSHPALPQADVGFVKERGLSWKPHFSATRKQREEQ
jgi:O-antigen/teichoic acid export membrane protein